MVAVAPRCRAHRAVAAWRCGGCGVLYCPDCVGVQRAGTVELPVCPTCRQPAEVLTRHREEVAPFAARIPGAFLYPLRGDAALALVALAAFLALMKYPGGLAHGVATCALWAMSFAVLRASSMGSDRVDLGEDGSTLEVMTAGLKAGLVWLLLGALGVAWFVFGRAPVRDVAEVFEDPVPWALLAVGIAWGPISTIMAATRCSVPQLLNPLLAFAYVVKLGTDYWVALTVVGLLSAAGLGLGVVAHAVDLLLPLPLVGKLLRGLVEAYFAFASARVLGLLLYVRGDRVGYGVASDYRVPWVEGAQARGPAVEAATALPESAYGVAGAQAFEAAMAQGPAASAAGRFDPIELPEEPAPRAVPQAVQPAPPREAPRALDLGALAPAEDFFARAVRDAVQHGDWPNAVAAWRQSATPPGALLSVEQLCDLGRAAAAAGDDAVARQALELAAAGEAWDGARARARVLLARVLAERFRDAAAAEALYRRVLQGAPGTEAASFAATQLGLRG